ncbi:MAG: 16S rRNA (adenine(1518)-N(6)/adenine(1519)-N(6))-dimethyltransferase RsmA [Acidobacteriia bacterium]|nr:16S rRNA (adenine(1518)-N(6)/adenine(1519)-N(6))-dimethyltransferase RsmA [Terriglobia bacterium]
MKTMLKKRYGQHFLRDTGILNRIVALIQPTRRDLMLEVGGGDGALSARLAPNVFRLLTLEIDGDLIPALVRALAPHPNAVVVPEDFLSADLSAIVSPYLEPGLRLRIVGNLPYNIGTAIIERLLLWPMPVEDMNFMLQLETAERIASVPGSRQYGFFSVFCQHYCEIKMGFKVSPACFVPRPKVESAMIILRPRSGACDPELDNDFLELTKAAFSYRRKKLLNSLRRDQHLGSMAREILAQAGIDGALRAEDLTVHQYERLARVYHEHKEKSRKA